MSDLSEAELENVFDFLTPKLADGVRCPVCSWNSFAARKVLNHERSEVGPQTWVPYVQLICENCKHVLSFTAKVLEGP